MYMYHFHVGLCTCMHLSVVAEVPYSGLPAACRPYLAGARASAFVRELWPASHGLPSLTDGGIPLSDAEFIVEAVTMAERWVHACGGGPDARWALQAAGFNLSRSMCCAQVC